MLRDGHPPLHRSFLLLALLLPCLLLLLPIGSVVGQQQLPLEGASTTPPQPPPSPAESSAAPLGRPGTSFLLSIGASQGDIQTLFRGRPVVGIIRPDERRLLQFAVQEVNGLLPDVLLTLTIASPAGDANLYCRPMETLSDWVREAGPDFNVWSSNHSTGQDYVFISRDDIEYRLLNLTVDNGERITRAAAFSCSIVGSRLSAVEDLNGATEFRLSLDVDYTRRSLVSEERQVLSSIFNKCCQKVKDCRPWRALKPFSTEVTTLGVPLVTPSIPGVALDFCQVRGNICNAQGMLLRLNMQDFGLQCTFPTEDIGKLTMLEKLELQRNKLAGDINEIVTKLQSVGSKIQHLGLSNNRLTSNTAVGSEDALSFCNFVTGQISFLDLQNNKIAFPIHHCINAPDSNLEELYLNGNPIVQGSLPGGFTKDSKIRVINLAGTQIDGNIPESLGNVPHLQVLDLSYNNISGSIPTNLGSSVVLEFVNLAKNKLVGSIPSSLAKSRTLKTFWGHSNELSIFPKEWTGDGKAADALRDVILASNRISGDFPTPLARAPNLLRFHLAGNRLTGSLPQEDDLFPRAVYIDFSSNKLRGKIPHTFDTLGMFEMANSTETPVLIDRTTNDAVISILDISNNSFSGTIPRFFVDVQFSRKVRIFLKGNKQLTCPYIIGVPCGEIFSTEENHAGRLVEINPFDVDDSFFEPRNETPNPGRVASLPPKPSPFGPTSLEDEPQPPGAQVLSDSGGNNTGSVAGLSLTVSLIAVGLIMMGAVVGVLAYTLGVKNLKNAQKVKLSETYVLKPDCNDSGDVEHQSGSHQLPEVELNSGPSPWHC